MRNNMHRHQVITGAANLGNGCFHVGTVNGAQFTAYASGSDIVILASDFQRVQIIPGAIHGYVDISCLSCSSESGKIAASYDDTVRIFEPQLAASKKESSASTHKLDYEWVNSSEIKVTCFVESLSWNQEGTKLLTGGTILQMWEVATAGGRGGTVDFMIDEDEAVAPGRGEVWRCAWSCKLAMPVTLCLFSPDGLLFATLGKDDRLVKIWYENKKIRLGQDMTASPAREEVSFSYIYIAHPKTVTGFSWRKTSRYMPRGSVANMLLTSCADNICRLWCETILPEDGLVDVTNLFPNIAQNPGFHAQRHKKHFLQRIHHIRHQMSRRQEMGSEPDIPPLPSTHSIHDFHKFGVHPGNAVAPGFHFHLAASINPETDIPLLPPLGGRAGRDGGSPQFVVHWLNNKEFHYCHEAERVIHNLATDNSNDSDTLPSNGDPDADRYSSESHMQRLASSDVIDKALNPLIRDWHQGSDMLFSIHPEDGSFLVWLVEWLDEYIPGSFRQAQVSFSSRIPHALPVGDAQNMSPHLLLYSNYGHVTKEKAALKDGETVPGADVDASAMGKNSPGQADNTLIPNVLMLSKHRNGSLNQWQITFVEESKFSTVLSVAHTSRVCGHRFHTSNAACHPDLPLLITSSHRKMPYSPEMEERFQGSELILWRVDPVGPLSKSGGISELSRLSSSMSSAFTYVAWLPVLLPSFTLGPSCNSPSALFVASDGTCLRVYQAVIDAKSLLAESGRTKATTTTHMTTSRSSSSGLLEEDRSTVVGGDGSLPFPVVSMQSTNRPGCILKLDSITTSDKDWQNVQLLHVFDEALIAPWRRPDAADSRHRLQTFYLVVVEGASGKSTLHMWQVTINRSVPASNGEQTAYTPDVNYSQQTPSMGSYSSSVGANLSPETSPTGESAPNFTNLSVTSTKVCEQQLTTREDVEILSVAPAAGHHSSASIYPARTMAPYLLAASCSDGSVTLWSCRASDSEANGTSFTWVEWESITKSPETSRIRTPGKAIAVSCAYSGRIAVAYKKTKQDQSEALPGVKCINLSVEIYECESTGGAEWVLEDRIDRKNISLPKLMKDLSPDADSSDYTLLHSTGEAHSSVGFDAAGGSRSIPSIVHSSAPPTSSTSSPTHHQGKIFEHLLQNKRIVQLDWVSTEDGAHILTVAVGAKINLYAAVSSEIAHANKPDEVVPASQRPRNLLQRNKSMTAQQGVEEIRWMNIRCIELTTADGLTPLPMHISWARDGLLVVGMDNEMHVYSQWRGSDHFFVEGKDEADGNMPEDKRTLAEKNLTNKTLTVAQSTSNLAIVNMMSPSPSLANMRMTGSVSTANLLMRATKRQHSQTTGTDRKDSGAEPAAAPSGESITSTLIHDCGLFEAARLANPVLPQYHPKQLIELLSFGKIKRVKAILAHLLRCISGQSTTSVVLSDEARNPSRMLSSPRPHNVSVPQDTTGGGTGAITEDLPLDYIEICSIPPLPLYALLAADEETSSILDAKSPTAARSANQQDYSTLFSGDTINDDELLDPFDDSQEFTGEGIGRERATSSSNYTGNPNYFGTSHSHLLSKYLTHTQLPGLSSLDQMYLLALADTVANTTMDFSEKQVAIEKNSSAATIRAETGIESIDDCGLRYMLAARHFIYLLNTLPMRQRAHLGTQGLNSSFLVWAFHSEAEEELLKIIPSVQKEAPMWNELKMFGVGWWVQNINTMRSLIEKVARAAFNVNKDPLDAAIFYIALKKKAVLWGLFRSINEEKKAAFWKNDFNQDVHRKVALKQAFHYLGKQKFQYAAAFFLLAGSLQDCIKVLLTNLEDMQLALVITRLYDTEVDENNVSVQVSKILNEECLGYDTASGEYDLAIASPDPFVRSIAYWILKDYSSSLNTLLETKVGSFYAATKKPQRSQQQQQDSAADSYSLSPSVFNFYNFLRTHPLLVRQQLAAAAASDNIKSVMLSGFTHGPVSAAATGGRASGEDEHLTYVDRITPTERTLFFATANAHFKNGCPMLALEVLTKLPNMIEDKDGDDGEKSVSSSVTSKEISGGKVEDLFAPKADESLASTDWSAPVSRFEESELELDWGNSDNDDEEDESKLEEEQEEEAIENVQEKSPDSKSSKNVSEDIMAQQLKFIACLKIMMEELSTLATGFEVDGGQLRSQLYIWLEKEVDVLKSLTSYGYEGENKAAKPTFSMGSSPEAGETDASLDVPPNSGLTLHEALIADKMDFEAKRSRTARRKKWLQENQKLLRTLLSYSVLHGSCGGGLASVRMELVLLLQELQQEKTQQQLESPLPFPTTLPLLSASVAPTKMLIADPIRHLQAMVQDLLHTVVEFKQPPEPTFMLGKVFVLRNLAAALASCIYQTLCDSDSFIVALNDQIDVGMEGFTSCGVVYKDSYLMAGAKKRQPSISYDEAPNTPPAKWPGVGTLRALLATNNDDNVPHIRVLLTDSLIAVYVSLLIHALSVYDANILYRLAANLPSEGAWPAIFGGGLKKLISNTVTESKVPQDDMNKRRQQLHMRILGKPAQRSKEEKPTYMEKFISPEVNMISFFMTKPYVNPDAANVDYDSNDSLSSADEEDEEDEFSTSHRRNEEKANEHCDPGSYSWCLMRFAIVKLVNVTIRQFLPTVGQDLADLPINSPLLQAALRIMAQWEASLEEELGAFDGPPDGYIPNTFVDPMAPGSAKTKYKNLIADPSNTPFESNNSMALPVKRLWHYLVRQPVLQEVFIRYIFKRKSSRGHQSDLGGGSTEGTAQPADITSQIIHRDLEGIGTFCVNQVGLHYASLATPKEVVELDIAGILNPPAWVIDDIELDFENIYDANRRETDDFLLVSSTQSSTSESKYHQSSLQSVQTGRGSSIVLKRKLEGVRTMGAHPHQPYYLTGSNDGSVRLWEWGHQQCIASPRQPGTFPKCTKLLFNAQGNKFGVSDNEGNLCLWQVGLGASMSRPFLSLKCHSKQVSDFVYVGSSSFLATAGSSSDGRNVCLWDTLLPKRSACVQAFTCHQDGAPAIIYAPKHNLLISAGRRGDVCLWDTKKRALRHTFQAHDNGAAVRALSLHPNENYFVTGSTEGDIKVWGLSMHELLYAFPAEHAKGSLFGKMAAAGVAQLYVSPTNHVYSCGADGSLKLRRVEEKALATGGL